jgi:hypothetical protein
MDERLGRITAPSRIVILVKKVTPVRKALLSMELTLLLTQPLCNLSG